MTPASSSTGRFVILHHTGFGQEHWDLMLEDVDSLASWRLYHEPATLLKAPMEAIRIGNHRLAYLDYEGPVAGERGVVRRVSQGTYLCLSKHENCWRILLSSGELSGHMEARQQDRHQWMIRLSDVS